MSVDGPGEVNQLSGQVILKSVTSRINVQVQGQNPHQWAPFQVAAGLLHAWQISHQLSRYIMRVDSRKLLLSAIPLCQLLQCYLGPPRPRLCINLYVKGCLDCTIGAFHMSIPAEPSLLQNKVQILKAPNCASSSLDLVVTMRLAT